MISLLIRLLIQKNINKTVPLGRWGYYWDKKKYQTYYE